MATSIVIAGNLIRCKLPENKQPRIYLVEKVARGIATLKLAWEDEGKPYPQLGVAKDFKVSALRNVEAYERDAK